MKPLTYKQAEQQARQISALLTILLLLIFLVVAYVWVIFRGTIPPEDENNYTIAGRIDFGYLGTPGSVARPAPVRQEVPEPVITKPEPSPVKQKTVPKPIETPPNPSAASAPQPQETQEETEEEEEEQEVFQPGGKPDASEAGDLGKGMLEFGEGDEGVENRRLLHFVPPRYSVQKEARVKFELFIQPDGSVSDVRALTLQAPPELKRAGEEAILQWRFNPIPRNQIQRLTVTIRFRLR
ncbi:MAG: TonB family protein [Bacteroidia bacterium]|nr:TonB family protein [Bacteroidia bacterium]